MFTFHNEHFKICRDILDLPKNYKKQVLEGMTRHTFLSLIGKEGDDNTGGYCIKVHNSAVCHGFHNGRSFTMHLSMMSIIAKYTTRSQL